MKNLSSKSQNPLAIACNDTLNNIKPKPMVEVYAHTDDDGFVRLGILWILVMLFCYSASITYPWSSTWEGVSLTRWWISASNQLVTRLSIRSVYRRSKFNSVALYQVSIPEVKVQLSGSISGRYTGGQSSTQWLSIRSVYRRSKFNSVALYQVVYRRSKFNSVALYQVGIPEVKVQLSGSLSGQYTGGQSSTQWLSIRSVYRQVKVQLSGYLCGEALLINSW